MTRNRWVILAGLLGTGLAAGCGSSSGGGGGGTTTQGGGAGFIITIQGMAFSPLNLSVPPGATVEVVNMDGSTPHSVTSETANGAFTPGAASGVQFDTGSFTGTRTFTVPANAPTGAVVPYFCMVHKGAMTTPNGSITIDPAAQPSGSTGTSGTSGTTGTSGMGGTSGTTGMPMPGGGGSGY